jgi:branched-chain amino acid transport system ATP-binding protein
VTRLEARGIRAGYGAGDVVGGADITVEQGQVSAVVGANGAGKSTLLKVISGLLRPRAGQVIADGRDIAGLSCAQRVSRCGIVLVPEGRQIFGGLSVLDNIVLGSWAARASATQRRERLELVWELFPVLAQRRDRAAGLLSGGQQQMLAIGRGLAAGPRYLLLDEPSLGLAPVVVAAIFRQVARLAETGIGVLVVEQNATVALSAASYGYVLETGRVADEGTGLLANAELVGRYFGVRGVVRGDGTPGMTGTLREALGLAAQGSRDG